MDNVYTDDYYFCPVCGSMMRTEWRTHEEYLGRSGESYKIKACTNERCEYEEGESY